MSEEQKELLEKQFHSWRGKSVLDADDESEHYSAKEMIDFGGKIVNAFAEICKDEMIGFLRWSNHTIRSGNSYVVVEDDGTYVSLKDSDLVELYLNRKEK